MEINHPSRISATGLWGHVAPPGAVKISGVNHLLNGADISQDFWPITPFVEQGQFSAIHQVTHATPEPGATVFFVRACSVWLALSGGGGRRSPESAFKTHSLR